MNDNGHSRKLTKISRCI